MLTLTANNTYAGGTTINAGTLSVGSLVLAGTGGGPARWGPLPTRPPT